MQAILRISVFFMIIYFAIPIAAQEKQDAALILTRDFRDSLMFKKKNVSFGIGKSNNYILKYNPVSLVFSGLMYTYQKWISPQVSADCLYSPSCSEYSKLLFREYGFFKGIFTSADRLMRCDRISATTLNPISVDDKDGKIHEVVSRYRIKSK